MPFSWDRFKVYLAGRAGAVLHVMEMICTVLYLVGAAYVGGMLAWMAMTQSLWLLLLAIPVLATTALFCLNYLRNPGLGFRMTWPVAPATRRLTLSHKGPPSPTV